LLRPSVLAEARPMYAARDPYPTPPTTVRRSRWSSRCA
jgi:hypothetical protein